MAAGNKSRLGFGTILLFHLCVLGSGVLLQNVAERGGAAFGAVLVLMLGVAAFGLFKYRPFLWDLFRSLKSSAALITLLVVSCILGTLIIQELDLRRAGVFNEGLAPEGKDVPAFDQNTWSTRFAVAETHALLWLWPNEERKKLTADKVQLSPFEEKKAQLRSTVFGEKAGTAFRKAILKSKERQVNDLTTSHYARKHLKGFYRSWLFFKGIRLFDIFEAWWFYFLLGLIGINVIVGTIARAPWTARDFGVAITHSGIIIILTGALLDVLVAKEGYIYFTYGRPELQQANKIYDQKDRVNYRLPFTVRLDRFATEHYHELLVERYDWSLRHDGSAWQEGNGGPRRGSPFSVGQTFPIRTEVPRVFEQGKVEVTVHAYKPRVFVETRMDDVDGGRPNPAVKLGLYNNPRGGRNYFVQGNSEPWLFAFDERRDLDLGEFRFEYRWVETEAEYRDLLREAPIPDNGMLVLRAGSEVKRVPVRLGKSVQVEIAGRVVPVTFVRIDSAITEADNVNLARQLQRTEEPLLRLSVRGQGVSVYRDDSHFTSRFDVLEGVEFRFDWANPRDNGMKNIYRVVDTPGQPRVLVQVADDDSAVTETLRRGKPIQLLGELRGGYLGIEGAAFSAREAREIREVTDEEFLTEGGGAQDDLLAAWADVEIKGEWGTVRRELTPYDPPIAYGPPNQPPLLRFAIVKTRQARDWFSVLSVVDGEGNKIKSHPVQVNSPLRYGGYRFFQATAATDRDGLGVSGISVTKNPGVNFMYVGYTILTIGVCYIFFARPIIDRRRRKRRQLETLNA